MESRDFFSVAHMGIEATYISRCVQKAASLRKHDATWLVNNRCWIRFPKWGFRHRRSCFFFGGGGFEGFRKIGGETNQGRGHALTTTFEIWDLNESSALKEIYMGILCGFLPVFLCSLWFLRGRCSPNISWNTGKIWRLSWNTAGTFVNYSRLLK